MLKTFYLNHEWLLRWRFDYANGSSVCGMWSNPGDGVNNSASKTNKNGLIKASIEAKHYQNQHTKVFAECLADEYKEHRWIAMTSLSRGVLPIHGMTLVTKETETDVMIDGSVKVNKRGER